MQTTSTALLKTLLAKELDAAQSFLDSLLAENRALTEAQAPDLLADVIQTKWYRANTLNAAVMERTALLATLGLGEDAIAALAESEPELKLLWEKVDAIFTEGRTQNGANGSLIEVLKKTNTEKMALLDSFARSSDTYTSKGRIAKNRSVMPAVQL